MDRNHRWLIVTLLLTLGACAHIRQDICRKSPQRPLCQQEPPSSPPAPPLPASPSQQICVDFPIDYEAEACPRWRWIAIRGAGETECPAPAAAAGGQQWAREPLFSPTADESLPPSLEDFCLYEYLAEGEAAMERGAMSALLEDELIPNLRALLGAGRLSALESDCAALAPSASSLKEAVRGDLYDHFVAEASRMPDRAPALPRQGPSHVLLTLIDTLPTGDRPPSGPARHGYALNWMARRLLCDADTRFDGGPCATHVLSRLALPIVRFDPQDPREARFDTAGGGYFGTVPTLARALWEALEQWQARTERHLVLNLSVAWHPRFGGLEDRVEAMPPSVQALYRVLEVASCQGALVVAAAGNRNPGPNGDAGPLLPAAWEARDAPDAQACDALIPSAYRGQPVDAEQRPEVGGGPLVYSVGGVRTDGSPLGNARPQGSPPRVAYADHAVVPAPGNGGWTETLTGTSVSAAVVSSAATAVWYYRPELSRREVMNLVDASGEALSRAADYYHASSGSPGDPPPVRQIALCPALRQACADHRGECPRYFPTCEPPPRLPPLLSSSVGNLEAKAKPTVDALEITEPLARMEVCGEVEVLYNPAVGVPTSPCPGRQFQGIAARPWTGPQPQSDPCPSCNMLPPPGGGIQETARRTLHIEISPDWRGGPLWNAFLDIGATSLAIDLPRGSDKASTPCLHDPGLTPTHAAPTGVGVLCRGDALLVSGISEAYLTPKDGGEPPPVLLRFQSLFGSVESQVFVGL